ncbi:hypothetical protein FKG94_08660 [Exilibacterium tricleocarpae]|uniref:Uncharacterized protein n=1 Tax=Exilibacterium tricleocarpae TaxID=2591008 RepID=A0A545TVC1_9GAMM|nr:DUF6880 family protein [Exilibacterium tricleocarpae]TQV81169.1 hypothetical protein FKG94_08660 [Exilibacterium tricleocarpae]
MKPSELEKQLAALSINKLAQLLADEASINTALRKTLELAIAQSDPKQLSKTLKRQIQSIKRSRRFIDWREAGEFTQGLYQLVTCIEQDLLPQDAQSAGDLLELMLQLDGHLCERMDDSGGDLRLLFDEIMAAWGKAWVHTETRDSNALAEKLFRHLANNEYGLKDDLVHHFKVALGNTGLEKLEGLITDNRDQFNDYALPGILEDIADAFDDVDKYIAIATNKRELNEKTVCEIATRLIDKWRSEEAIQWLLYKPNDISQPDSDTRCDLARAIPSERYKLLLKAYDAETLLEEAQTLRWRLFETTLGQDYYLSLIKHQSADQAAILKQQALDFALEQYTGSLSTLLSFLVDVNALDRASQVVLERHESLDPNNYCDYRPLSKTLANTGYYLAACILRRTLVDGTLGRALSTHYRYAVSDLKLASRYAGQVTDWQSFPTQAEYMINLKETHGRKKAFWTKLETEK